MSTPITSTGAYTCIHHSDQQRAACPVCLVAALTAERDQLRSDCENETKWAAHYLAQAIADKARAERAEARLDWLCDSSKVYHVTVQTQPHGHEAIVGCGVTLRDAIAAAMKEDTK